MTHRGGVRLAGSFALVLTLGCADPFQPNAPEREMSQTPSTATVAGRTYAIRDVPAVLIDPRPQLRAFDTSDGELVRVVAAADGRVGIGFKEPLSPAALDASNRSAVSANTIRTSLDTLAAYGVEVLDYLEYLGIALARIDPELAPVLRRLATVDFVEPYQSGSTGNSERLESSVPTRMLAQTTPWGVDTIGAPAVWQLTTGTGVKVGIVDTGHDPNHPDLPSVPSSNCDGIFGTCGDRAFNPGHGTLVLGIATARDNSFGIVGVAPGVSGANTYVYQAGVGASFFNGDVTAGVNWAISKGVEVLNMSIWDLPFDPMLNTAVNQAYINHDMVIIGITGNDASNQISYPGKYTVVRAISGINRDKSFASPSDQSGVGHCSLMQPTSTSGSETFLTAAFDVLSTIRGGGYGVDCGTSFSAPFVTGVATLLRSRFPSWSASDVIERLWRTAEDLGPTGHDDQFGWGLVDAERALLQVAVERIDGPSQVVATDVCTWTAVVQGGVSPFSYLWTNDGVTVSQQQQYIGGQLPGDGDNSFDLEVRVTDSVGDYDTHTLRVTTNPMAPPCSF